MKKLICFALTLVFVLSIATTAFAAKTTAEDVDWKFGSWFQGNPACAQGGQTDDVVVLKQTAVAGNVSLTMTSRCTNYCVDGFIKEPTYSENGFYFMADVDPVKDGDTITGVDVKDAYLIELNNVTLKLTLYKVTDNVKTQLKQSDSLDTLLNLGTDLSTPANNYYGTSRGAIAVKADFTVDGNVTISAKKAAAADYTEIFKFAPEKKADAPKGNQVAVSSRMIHEYFSKIMTGELFDFSDCTVVEIAPPKTGDTTAIVAIVALVATIGCAVVISSKKRIAE